MSFHKKALLIYILTNLVLVVLGSFQLYWSDTAGMTDPDLASHGAAKTFWPVISVFITGIAVALVYALRSLWVLGAWSYRKVALSGKKE